MALNIQEIRELLKEKDPTSLVTAEHSDDGHFYRYAPTNRLFASVTTKSGILDSPHLKKWAAKLAVTNFLEKVNHDIVDNRNSVAATQLAKESVLVHQDQFEEAGDIGTRGHKFVEDYLLEWMETDQRPADIKTFVTDDDARCMAIARSAEMFCHDYDAIPIASEMFVASEKYEFAGTLDSLFMVMKVKKKPDCYCGNQMSFDGSKKRCNWMECSKTNPNKRLCMDCGAKGEYRFSIVDWKTSNSIDKVEYAMQVAAYWQALYELTGLRPLECYVVRLDKYQAKYDIKKLSHRPSAFAAFKHCAKIWEWLNNGTDKLIRPEPKEVVTLGETKETTNINFKEV